VWGIVRTAAGEGGFFFPKRGLIATKAGKDTLTVKKEGLCSQRGFKANFSPEEKVVQSVPQRGGNQHTQRLGGEGGRCWSTEGGGED